MSKGSSTLFSQTATANLAWVGLHPVLQAALDSLDIELNEELIRYRRQRYRQARQAEPEQIPVWQPPIVSAQTPPQSRSLQLPFTRGTSVQNVMSRLQQTATLDELDLEDDLNAQVSNDGVRSSVTANPVPEPPESIAPQSVELPEALAAGLSQHSTTPQGTTFQPETPPTDVPLAAASFDSVDPDWEELIQAAANPNPVNVVPASEFESTFNSDDFEAGFNSTAEDYLRSNEELLRSIVEESAQQQSRQEANLLDSLLTPLGVGSMALVLLSSATLGYVIMHPSSLDFLWSSKPASQSDRMSSGSEPFASPLIPDSPNLAADEFVDLNVNNLSTLPSHQEHRSPLPPTTNSGHSALTPTVAPPPTTLDSAPVAPNPGLESPTESAPAGISESLPLIESAPASAPIYVAPEPPIVESANSTAPIAVLPPALPTPTDTRDPDVATAPAYQHSIDSSGTGATSAQSAGTYYVVAPYSGDSSLQQAREAVPDAYVRNFATGASVQLGVFNNQENAQELLQQLAAEGISAEIYQP
jgi:hypothetical protein